MNNLKTKYSFKIIEPDLENIRLDKVICSNIKDLSRMMVVNLIQSNNVTVNNMNVSKSYKVKINDQVDIYLPEPQKYNILPEKIPLDIVYEDNDILIVNKPKNMVVHPANGHYTGTLVNALLYYCKDSLSGINGVCRPGIVHRIDKNTSGLLIVAKNDYAHTNISQQIKLHSFKRIYHAVVYGNISDEKGIIQLPIGRSQFDRKKMSVTYRNSKPATTIYKKIKGFNQFSYVMLQLETGRTHQIRVHMSYIGHPLAGDDVYGPKKVITELNGQCLHAKIIGFIHPTKKTYIEFDSELPEYFKQFLYRCENN